MSPPIQLTEYQPAFFPAGRFTPELGRLLLRHYRPQIEVEFPTPKTDNRWLLTPQGWAGYLPLTPEVTFLLQPKVPLANLFRMLEYAYRLNLKILEGLANCRSLPEFYERLAHFLARRVLDRGRKGFYRAYLAQTERLTYLRGRLDVSGQFNRPGQPGLACLYEDQTADIEANQILAWTLFQITRSGSCSERVLPIVRQAYRALHGSVTLTPYSPEACLRQLYHRLNEDYRLLHALCRFFLAHSGPSHQVGEQVVFPFLINIESLYEAFVAEWLKQHVPPGLTLQIQAPAGNESISALIDLVLYEAETGRAAYVLDTKYKSPERPANADIYQIVAYAQAKGCREAVLIYPTPLPHPVDTRWGDIHVRSLTFSLEDDLEEAGQKFLEKLN